MVLSFADLSVWCCHLLTSQYGALPVTRTSTTRSEPNKSLTYCDNTGTIIPQVLLPYIDSAHRHKFGEPSPYAPQAAEEDKP